jgi:hypothetical protein
LAIANSIFVLSTIFVDDILKYVPMHFYLLIIVYLILVAAVGNNLGLKLLRFSLIITFSDRADGGGPFDRFFIFLILNVY